MWNKDEVKGKAEQAKGVVKEKTGQLLGDEELEADGVADQAEGKVRETVGTVKRKASDAVDAVRRRIETDADPDADPARHDVNR